MEIDIYLDNISSLLTQGFNYKSVEERLISLKEEIIDCKKRGNKVILMGNGGSSSIASHLSVDFTKAAGIRAVDYNSAGLITCLANDYGYDNWMQKALEMYAEKGDVVILISSSGNSNNVVNAGKYWKNLGPLVTFTGFSYNNELNSLKANHRFWVKSKAYNHVEMVHHIWLVAVVDMIIGTEVYSA